MTNLLERIARMPVPTPPPPPVEKSAAATDEPVSKSRRIREYLEKNPEASNQEVLDGLKGFEIKYGDVANVRQQLKKKGNAAPAGKRGRPPKSKSDASPPSAAVPSATKKATVASPAPDYVDLAIIEQGVEFIRRCGDMDRALYVLDVIRRIRSV